MKIKQVIGTTSTTSQNPQFNLDPSHAIVWELKLMHKNLVWKGIWSKCELACNVDEDDSHSKLLIVLLVTLRSIYRKQAIVTTHKQSLKRSERTKKTIQKHQNQANNSCNIKQFLTVPKLCKFGLIRKFRSRASISKRIN